MRSTRLGTHLLRRLSPGVLLRLPAFPHDDFLLSRDHADCHRRLHHLVSGLLSLFTLVAAAFASTSCLPHHPPRLCFDPLRIKDHRAGSNAGAFFVLVPQPPNRLYETKATQPILRTFASLRLYRYYLRPVLLRLFSALDRSSALMPCRRHTAPSSNTTRSLCLLSLSVPTVLGVLRTIARITRCHPHPGAIAPSPPTNHPTPASIVLAAQCPPYPGRRHFGGR
ncbi:hypothetical protein DFP72DRAFT_1065121 [Ephemerocybe angulata]|uniref:Uncharacterized protein n=1 Tax=Ephemerocybe angulata TaxID=980116 RepID=A0A8H6I4N4_9AGAR|nr:hypothetical protein DFP72DRAFT_1065121 [Tulosesus angulatus]